MQVVVPDKVAVPDNEMLRLAYLRSCDLLDTDCEQAFDDIAQMASSICGTPIAAISLIDENRQWFKSIVGLDVKETSRDVAFCAHTIMQSDVFAVEDAASDPRFRDNALVTGDPLIRFYAGAPVIVGDNFAVGSLCVIDYAPRRLTREQTQSLRILARHTASLIQMRSYILEEAVFIAEREAAKRELAASEEKFRSTIHSMQEGIVVQDSFGTITLCNQQAELILGLTEDQMCGRSSLDSGWHCITEDFDEMPGDQHPAMLTLKDGIDRTGFVMGVHKPNGDLRWISVNTSLVAKGVAADRGAVTVVSTFVDITDRKLMQFQTARLAAVVESSQDAMITVTADGTVTSWNPGAVALYGYTAEEAIGRSILMTSPGSDYDVTFRANLRTIQDGEPLAAFDSVRRAKDGSLIDVSVRLSALRSTSGAVVGISSVIRDIREEKRTNERLRRSEQMLTDAQSLAGLGSWEMDAATGLITWSAALYRITGIDPESGPPTRAEYLAMLEPSDRATYLEQIQTTLETGMGYDVERRLTLPNGSILWAHLRTNAEIVDGRPVRLFGTVLDITKSKKAEEAISDANIALEFQMMELQAANQMLADLSTTDGLTGVKNHRAFQERYNDELNRTARHANELSILMIDVDHFKAYNDSFGHPAGDDVLRKVAALIGQTIRITDFVARYGGEEFVVILPETGVEGAKIMAQRILQTVAGQGWAKRDITASIGSATSSASFGTDLNLLELADKALYESKKAGRNRVTQA